MNHKWYFMWKFTCSLLVAKQEIQTLLNEAIKPLERKIDIMAANFIELKKTVEFFGSKLQSRSLTASAG